MSDQDIALDRLEEREDRWLASAWLRSRFERTRSRYTFDDRRNRGEEYLPRDIREPNVLDKLDRAVLVLADRSTGFGGVVLVVIPEVAPLLWARPGGEAGAILGQLVEAGLAKRMDTTRQKGDPLQLVLTASGWKRVEELRPLVSGGRHAFVAMRFSEQQGALFGEGIAPALEACGYKPYVVNRDHFVDKIDDKIIAEIRRSALVVADLTGHRQNVYYEAGFAFGLGIPVVWTCKQDEIAGLHFDIRQYTCLGWSSPTELRQMLEERVRALYPLKGVGT